MKKSSFIFAGLLLFCIAARAQEEKCSQQQDKKVYWSALFGLFGNAKEGDSIKVKPVEFDFEVAGEYDVKMNDVDSAERRSLLWGAIQYSVKDEAGRKKHKQVKQ